MDELFEKIQKLIAEKLDIDEAKITLDSSFRNDLGADSLDTYELVYAIQEELGVNIPDEKASPSLSKNGVIGGMLGVVLATAIILIVFLLKMVSGSWLWFLKSMRTS